MKRITNLAMIVLAMGLAVGEVYAQNQTVQTVTINLTGVRQSTSSTGLSTVKISNKDILQALGGSGTNATFSSKAKLVAITPDGGTTGIFVRDVVDHQNVDTDVSGNFSNATLQSLTTANGATEISIQTFSFDSDTVGFNVQGYTTGNTRKSSENSQVNGTGTVNGDAAVLKGFINLGPAKSE
jgi:hypothetical protein